MNVHIYFRRFNMTSTPWDGPNIPLVFVGHGTSVSVHRLIVNLFNVIAIAILYPIVAKRMPTHIRGPKPNGIQAALFLPSMLPFSSLNLPSDKQHYIILVITIYFILKKISRKSLVTMCLWVERKKDTKDTPFRIKFAGILPQFFIKM